MHLNTLKTIENSYDVKRTEQNLYKEKKENRQKWKLEQKQL